MRNVALTIAFIVIVIHLHFNESTRPSDSKPQVTKPEKPAKPAKSTKQPAKPAKPESKGWTDKERLEFYEELDKAQFGEKLLIGPS